MYLDIPRCQYVQEVEKLNMISLLNVTPRYQINQHHFGFCFRFCNNFCFSGKIINCQISHILPQWIYKYPTNATFLSFWWCSTPIYKMSLTLSYRFRINLYLNISIKLAYSYLHVLDNNKNNACSYHIKVNCELN